MTIDNEQVIALEEHSVSALRGVSLSEIKARKERELDTLSGWGATLQERLVTFSKSPSEDSLDRVLSATANIDLVAKLLAAYEIPLSKLDD